MKSRIEALEKELSEVKAASTVSSLQGNGPGPDEVWLQDSYASFLDLRSPQTLFVAIGISVIFAQIEQCCEVLASIETQTSRLCKQVEKIDQAQKVIVSLWLLTDLHQPLCSGRA